MEAKVNGINANGSGMPLSNGNGHANEYLMHGLETEPSQEELEKELFDVYDGQISLGDLLSRVVQAIYAELTEMAETLPGMSDAARKRTIADWVVKTKKQVVKLYAIMRWSRDASDVQKAMNITAFLMEQNRQFEEAVNAITFAKESLAPARLRNHDLLTSLDVLTTGSYLRLPSQIKKFFITPAPLADDEVKKTLKGMEEQVRYRLRMNEIVPIEMSQYRIEDGRVHFTVPNLFEASISLRGAQKEDGWFFVHIEFLHTVGGDLIDVQDFPRRPTDMLKRHITEEADGRLAYYLPLPADPNAPPDFRSPPRPQLPAGTVDTPLVRLFNFLQMMSMSYQLEILLFQAHRLRSLGWREYLTLEKSKDSKSFTASYWIRPSNNAPGRPQLPQRMRVPPIGGTLTISLVETHSSGKAGGGPLRTPKDRILAKLQRDSKLGDAQPSDEVETFRFEVKWEPMKGALGVIIPPELESFEAGELEVNSQNLNFEAILRKAVMKHVYAILAVHKHSLENGPHRAMFSFPGEVSLVVEDGFAALRVHLCADEYITVSVDPRTGRITLRDTGGLSASGKGPRYSLITDKINDNPFMVCEVLVAARFTTIVELAEQKAQYMGLETFRARNLPREEVAKFGMDIRAYLFIRLASCDGHYMVLLVTELEFRFALISVRALPESPTGNLIINDIGWLDVQRIHDGDILVKERTEHLGPDGHHLSNPGGSLGSFGSFDLSLGVDRFKLETDVLRELYSYCCARVAYTKVELQLKMRNIMYTYMGPDTSGMVSPEFVHLQSSLARSVPALCVQSSDILAGVPAAEAAMPNIRVIPLNWWSNRKSQVVTCVKLKYVQQPVGKRAGTSTVIRPSKRIIYDAREAIVSFLSENVDTCVNEFLEEWAKVSKMVVIAREVAQMAKQKSWGDVQLLSFDLQTVEFTYAKDYTVSITCTDQLMLSNNSSYELSFSRTRRLGRLTATAGPSNHESTAYDDEYYNPHEDAEPFLRHVLRHGPRLSSSLHQLVELLRDSLPLVCVMDVIRRDAGSGKEGDVHVVDVFPKAAGWYRVLYGDSRHALDLRLMKGRRVAILDASLRVANFTPYARAKLGAVAGSAKSKAWKQDDEIKSVGKSVPNMVDKMPNLQEIGVLLPIPRFADLVREAVRDAMDSNNTSPVPGASSDYSQLPTKRRCVVQIDTGLICDVDAVELYAPRVHSRILKSLADLATRG
ncbi:hypothetical protein M0805_001593 [Coniferiporia weirii]|nr:hypothetical protein M0805_001593 [Coniferiporia weirii]